MCTVCAFLYLLKNLCLKGINKLFIAGIVVHVFFCRFSVSYEWFSIESKKT